MASPRLIVPVALTATVAMLATGIGSAAAAGSERPMGHVFDWGHELTQKRLPGWNPATAPPIAAARWYRAIGAMLGRAGRNGLWFSGYAALPFDIPLDPAEPRGWRTPGLFTREYRATGLSWDVNVEARAATNALARRQAVVADPGATAPARRVSLIDPGYERAATAEIRRLVPRYARLPYVHAYTGSDEPIATLPRGPAVRTAFAKRLRAGVLARYGWAPPSPAARPSRSVTEGLRWLAYHRFSSDRFFDMKARQARLIHALDPDAVVVPNDYGFLDGFVPWDYTRLATIADLVEADPYASLLERSVPGRGRYNHGFGAKFLADLTGRPVRIIVEAFPYAGHTPTPADIERWTSQALRSGASDISFYALGNPRFTDPPLYTRMLSIAQRLRGSRLPGRPTDPASIVVYSTTAEGQARPHLRGDRRALASGDGLYTTYALLGELAHGAFTFESDARLMREPERLAAARIMWMPRADTLDRPFAEQVLAWVRAGGVLVVSDPRGFTRTPRGGSLADVHNALIGTRPEPRTTASTLIVDANALGPAEPGIGLTIPLTTPERRSFATVPADAVAIARFADGTPGVIARHVGAGRVIAFAADPMVPGALLRPSALAAFVAALQRVGGGATDDPAWGYQVPPTPAPPARPPTP